MDSEAYWKNKLSDLQYTVLRQKGTEKPFTGKYTDCYEEGIYRCAGCGTELFGSADKFDSHCGWPSFDKANNVQLSDDNSHWMHRTEVTCMNCGGHLGHVFDDGPTETGKRYCINSVSLELEKKVDLD